jgi:alkylated DNA repair dioxygenase AlkB
MLISSQKIDMSNADVVYYKSLFSEQSHYFLSQLTKESQWQQHPIKIFGKTLPEPRLTVYYGDKFYRSILLEIKSAIAPLVGVTFNAVLLNLYRDSFDSVGWHIDNQKELGLNPTIASVSFGATRRFIFRRKDNHQNKFSSNF